MSELHEIRTDTPNWDTKQRCTCGYESVSRCEQHKHASDALRAQAERDRAVIEAARAVLRTDGPDTADEWEIAYPSLLKAIRLHDEKVNGHASE